ncbi:MAG: TolC family protein [Akkermansiaceae bacterium]|nr:TolC family protein [Akkermansiaceae bacterium]
MKIHYYTAALCAMALSSCITYQAEPIDLSLETEEWAQISTMLCQGTHLSREKMLDIGLLLNRDLNQARLKVAKSTSVAEFAGLWEDPTISFELERVFGENITNNAISPGLTLPVTGLPALSAKIAEQYQESDYWEMRAAERRYMMELECLRHRIMVTHTKLDVMKKRLAVMQDEQEKITRLYELGEVDFGAFQVATQRLNDTRRELMELETEHLRQRNELIEKLGLHPAVGDIELGGHLPHGVPGTVSAPTPDLLLNTPSLLAMQAAYGASETELRAEIRKQYPELGISPLYARDGGNDKVSLGFSFSLPIWNRNREAIARATGDRALKQAELITEWCKLVQQATLLDNEQHLLHHHCTTEFTRLKELENAANHQEALFKLGETSILELAESRHVAYERHITYLDCLSELLEARCKLQYLNPTFNQQ